MFPSFSLKCVDFFPCPLLPKSPLSEALDARKNGRPDSVFQLEYYHFCSSVPISVLLIRMGPVPTTARESASVLRHFNRILNALSVFPFSRHSMSLYIDMKMILPMKCSGSNCIPFTNF